MSGWFVVAFVAGYGIVFGDEKCEKAIKRYALNCPSKDKDRIERCVKFENERTECLEKKHRKKRENLGVALRYGVVVSYEVARKYKLILNFKNWIATTALQSRNDKERKEK